MYYVNNNSMFISLYPYINGKNGWEKNLSGNQFIRLGNTIYNIHSIDIPKNIQEIIPKENYSNVYRNYVTDYFNTKSISKDNFIKKFNSFVTKHNKKIISILDTANTLVNKIKEKNKKYCLCHGDLHAGNLIITGKTFYIIDWDTIIFAPKEKDLMFIGGGIGNKWNTKETENAFYKGYNNKNIDYEMLLYYRCERILIDFKEFYEQIRNMELSVIERNENLKAFKTQFEQNNVIDIAIRNINEIL
jgi:spectinomycin phosphotransferase